MRIGLCFFLALPAFLLPLQIFCLDLEKDFKPEIALYRIRPDQVHSLKRDQDGTPVTEPVLIQSVRNFYARLYPLQPKFLKRFKIKTVVFKDTVYDSEGKQFQRRLVGDTLYLDADIDERQFYMNIFLLYVPAMQRSYIGHWTKLNPDAFSYEDRRGSPSAGAQKKLDAVLAEWDRHFVTRVAMYSPEIDMAETFTYMIMRGPDATAFARKNSPDLLKKFNMVNEILESVKAVDPGYMQTILAEDLSKLKTYSPEALSVRLFREYSGVWSASHPVDEDEETKKPAGKIGDPVEVAGRKIDPLILSLEMDDIRLFRLLMEHQVDPNAVDGKKKTALMLAIGNNNPEQVKLLLDAGAKVTTEIARAGTSSGVNAEIVKLLNPYLPGVRALERTEKTPRGRAGGNTGSAGRAN